MGYTFHEHGIPQVDAETCTACGQCVAICPDEVLALQDGRPQAGPGLLLGCIACGHCMAVCPTGSIRVTGRRMAVDDCPPLPSAESRATAEQFEALAVSRRSVRRFKPREIPREFLEQIIRAASTAPMGIPPNDVGIVVFSNRQKVQEFAEEACAAFARMARVFNPVVLALMRPFIGKFQYEGFRDFIRPLMQMLPKMRKQGRDLFAYDAPAAMVFHGDQGDAMIAATYAMLAAETLGLGSCMLGTTVALNHVKAFKVKYGIPPENKVGVTLVVGYPAVTFRHALRRRFAKVNFVT